MKCAALVVVLCGLTALAQPKPLEWAALVELMRAPDASSAKKKLAVEAFLAGHRAQFASPRMALVFRAQEALVSGKPAPAATFFARVSLEECRRFSAPLGRKPQILADPCESAVRWQASLDAGWRATKPAEAREAAAVVIEHAAPMRDELDALATVIGDPKKYFAELFGVSEVEAARTDQAFRVVRSMLFELVSEADLLMVEASGSTSDLEQFGVRYPAHPFTPSILFALGRNKELLERFPRHPLAKLAAPKPGPATGKNP